MTYWSSSNFKPPESQAVSPEVFDVSDSISCISIVLCVGAGQSISASHQTEKTHTFPCFCIHYVHDMCIFQISLFLRLFYLTPPFLNFFGISWLRQFRIVGGWVCCSFPGLLPFQRYPLNYTKFRYWNRRKKKTYLCLPSFWNLSLPYGRPISPPDVPMWQFG